MKSTDKKEKDIQKHKNTTPQVQTHSFHNLPQPYANSILSNQIKAAMNSIEKEIILLTKKRSIPFNSFTLSTSSYLSYSPPNKKIINNKRDYPYLLQIFKSYVFSNPEQENSIMNNKVIKLICIN